MVEKFGTRWQWCDRSLLPYFAVGYLLYFCTFQRNNFILFFSLADVLLMLSLICTFF